jgi:ATP-dependent RNA helicase RhlB
MTQHHLSNQHFTDFDLPAALQRGIEKAGFKQLTPIQAGVLPHLLAGLDVAGQAQTGTGKTAAFLIAMFTRLQSGRKKEGVHGPRALILAPTRELAIQIFKDAEALGCELPHRLALAYGGTGYESQRRELERGCDVLIGTPGRIIDYFKQRVFSLDAVEVMILDEADRMFDLGFIKDIRYLLRRMPPPAERLNMLFSATLSMRVNELAYEHMNNPQNVKIESDSMTVDAVEEVVYFPANEEKIPLLIKLLREIDPTRTLLFVNTKHAAEQVGDSLRGNGFSTAVLSGDVPQRKRERLLQDFKSGKIALLVATDVAARGLHIPDVSHVINYDLPQDPEDYVHRVGRTARAGAEGDAISFACETHAFSLGEIEQYVGHKIPTATFDASQLPNPLPPERSRSGERRLRGGRAEAGRPRDGADRKQRRRGPEPMRSERQSASGSTQSVEPESTDSDGARAEGKDEQPLDHGLPGKPGRSATPQRRREVPAVG